MKPMPDTTEHVRRTFESRRRRWLILGSGGVLAVAVIVMALFQPWKLWVDEKVNEAVPLGAVQITSPTATTQAAASPTVPAVPAGGAFVSIDHGTSGMVVLLEDATGIQFVRLENLDTSNGPDLFVYMSTNPPDGREGQFDDDYVNLGRLEGNVGSSNYVIPAGTDLSRYASVVIWCDRFNSAFGAAPLSEVHTRR